MSSETDLPLDPAKPGWNWLDGDVAALMNATAELVVDAFRNASSGSVTTEIVDDVRAQLSSDGWPERGSSVESVLAAYSEVVAPYPFGNGHPRFAAWVNSPPHPIGVAGAALATALNPSVAGGSHAAVYVERQVIRWFADLLGWSTGAAGQFVSGGSAATLTALVTARHRATARAGYDDRVDGLQAFHPRLVVYATDEAHSCVTKAVEALGIGSANIIRVTTDAQHRMDPADLDRRLIAGAAAGVLPVAVVASAGTVNTGAIDPLESIAEICTRHQVWLHVDGAYGAPAVMLLDEWGDACRGLAAADSIAIDAHKWLYVPVDAGMVLFRDEANLRDTFSLVPPYLRTDGADEPVWFSEYGLEQTRPFRALKVWMQLLHLGRYGYRRLIARDISVAEDLRRQVDDSEDFEVLAHGLSVVCLRHRPRGLPTVDLDQHNKQLLRELQHRRDVFITGTVVDDKFALRACIVNPHTTTHDIRAVLAAAAAAAPTRDDN